MKKYPKYRKALEKITKNSLEGIEDMLKLKWEESDETLNNGDVIDSDDYGSDEIYND